MCFAEETVEHTSSQLPQIFIYNAVGTIRTLSNRILTRYQKMDWNTQVILFFIYRN